MLMVSLISAWYIFQLAYKSKITLPTLDYKFRMQRDVFVGYTMQYIRYSIYINSVIYGEEHFQYKCVVYQSYLQHLFYNFSAICFNIQHWVNLQNVGIKHVIMQSKEICGANEVQVYMNKKWVTAIRTQKLITAMIQEVLT